MDTWITYARAAELLCCDKRTISKLVESGRLVSLIVPGARPKVSLASVERLRQECMHPRHGLRTSDAALATL